MLFNSFAFIFAFLPLVLGIHAVLVRQKGQAALIWLLLASLFFYGWWVPQHIPLLLLSMLFNYAVGRGLTRQGGAQEGRKALLAGGLIANLALLGYFKYAAFFVANLVALTGLRLGFAAPELPLGISFFTFTQIAFLVDAYQRRADEPNPVSYGLFVSYFPHLIAGPILHHREMMPQFAAVAGRRLDPQDLAVGLMIFEIGLFKKTFLADSVASYAGAVFDYRGTLTIGTPSFFECWIGALAYTLQLYFDFSGYSDMAIGISRMFGILLPLNFASPYKAANVIDFWRRWHMTLSRFLRDYLYIPLGGNRRGPFWRHVNLMITMLLGGLWHGAGWTFVIWGGLHGFYLIVNHLWRSLRKGAAVRLPLGMGRVLSVLVTFLAVVFAWVFFRAPDLDRALLIVRGMLGMNGVLLPDFWLTKFGAAGPWLRAHGVGFADLPGFPGARPLYWIIALLAIVWLLPNTQQLLARFRPALEEHHDAGGPTSARLQWRMTPLWAAFGGLLGLVGILCINQASEFLYFQF